MRDNVTITDESYVGPRGGFGVEDYLIPQRPTTTADVWFEPYQDTAGLSLSGGLSNPSGNQQPEQKADTGLKAEDVDLSGVQPQRRRRSFGVQAMARGIDLFDMISGVDKDAYLGKTLANEIEYEKKLAEEDPEGYQADVNRAKLLSQRAYETEDVELKKKYGAAIKKLLPAETAGLDDLTASAYYTGNEKMEIEKLKASTQLAREKVKGEYGLQKQELSNENRIDVQGMKNDARKEHDALQYELELAKKDKDFERYAMIRDRMAELKEFEKAADYEREVMKQMEANYRTEYAADQGLAGRMYTADLGLEGRQYTADQGLAGRMYTADQGLAGRMYTADQGLAGRMYTADKNLERTKIQQAAANMRALIGGGKNSTQAAKNNQAQAMVSYLTSDEQIAEFDKLNEAAGQFSWAGENWATLIGSQRGQAWRQLESYMTRGIVQLAKSLGSNPSNEDARRISAMFGLDSHLSPARRREAWLNTLQYIAATSQAGLPVDGSVSPQQVAGYYAANANIPQATNDIQNIEIGSIPSGQQVNASGNYLF